MLIEYALNHVYYKDDDANPEAIKLQAKGRFEKTMDVVIDVEGRFQRISVYENDIIVCEEMLPGQHIFRFNKPYSEVEPGVLVFE